MSKSIFLLLLLLLSVPLFSQADELKIAVINMENVFKEYYKTKTTDQNLKRQAEVYKAYADKLTESLTKLKQEFKELRDASQNIALSESEQENKRLAAQDKYRQLKAKDAELVQYNREKQQSLRQQYDKMRKKLLEEITLIVKKRCVLEGYSLVIDISGKTLNNIPAVIYNSPSMDITKSILEELNRGHVEKTERSVKLDSEKK
jgi:Skp family chaperone for outer membrane proteins